MDKFHLMCIFFFGHIAFLSCLDGEFSANSALRVYIHIMFCLAPLNMRCNLNSCSYILVSSFAHANVSLLKDNVLSN